nr:MAG TPA: hypothetical protein [Bacteriophage sp.]
MLRSLLETSLVKKHFWITSMLMMLEGLLIILAVVLLEVIIKLYLTLLENSLILQYQHQ